MTLITSETISSCKDGEVVQITAALSNIQIKQTKRTRLLMALANIESTAGPVDVIIFPDLYPEAQALIKEGAVVTIHGQIDDGRPEYSLKIKATKIEV